MSAWIPKTKNIYDDDYQFLYEYPINYSNINRRLRKIICNNEICHAITENGLVFSWGNDFYHKGTLGLGDNIFQVNTPVLNKYLSKVRVFDISLSEEHCAAIDYNNYLYTWGVEEHGELGYYDENEKKVCEPIRVNLNKKPFSVEKIKCGKYYTAGINNKGIAFLFGNKNIINANKNKNNIIFFSFKENFNYDLMAKDIYCGEDYLIILLDKEKMLIYSFNDGLFEIKLNNENNNYIISKINIVDKNFYILDEKNKHLFEFVYYNKSFSKPFNIYDFYQNEYEINSDIKLSIIEMPFFVKFIFFWIECSENEKKEFISQQNKMFYKLNEINFHRNCNKGPNINEFILFGNNKKKIELIKVDYKNIYNQRESLFLFKGESIYSYTKNRQNTNSNNTIESSFQSLNIPISNNYGNKNDVNDFKSNKLNFDIPINTITINNEEKNDNDNFNNYNRITLKYKYNYENKDYRNKYSISQDKKRNKINNEDSENEEFDENYKKVDEKKYKINKNKITLDNNEINNNTSLIPNKKRENNTFLKQNKQNFNRNDNKENNEKYNHIQIKNNKKRSFSQLKEGNGHKYHNISSVTTNANMSKKDENDFDNILNNIKNRKLMLNQPVKIENNAISTKKILSQIGKTKSKTEMLIKELHETFFGKDYIQTNTNIINKNELKDEYINNKIKENEEEKSRKENIIKMQKEEIEKEEKEKMEKKLKKEREEKMRLERLIKEKERKEKERIEKEKKEKERIEKELKTKEEKEKKEKIRKEREEKEKKEKEEFERLKKEKEKIEKEKKERERIEKELKEKKEKEIRERLIKEKEKKEREEKERKEKEKKEREEKEEREKIIKMRLEKEKLEKEIQEIKEKKEKELLINEKLEKERIEKEKIINQQKIIELEVKKKKEALLEKELREKLENEYKEKYEKEKLKKEEEQRKEKEKLEKLEKEKNEIMNKEKKLTMEKIKELEKKKEILEELEKEKKYMEEQRKNLSITSEIKNFIEGKNNKNFDKLNSGFKFLPERLKTENENEFIMKGIDKKYNYTISSNQQFNIENSQINNNINKTINTTSKKYINSNNDLNLHIEDIESNRDIIFDNINNNIPQKIESLEEESKNILHDLPLKLNNSNNFNKKSLEDSSKINNYEDNDKSLKFAIENNNKIDINLNKDKEKEKEDSLELTNISNKDKEKVNNQSNINIYISDEENDNNVQETVLELEENKKKFNFKWKEKSKNRINEIIEEKQELEMIQSIDNTLKNNKDNNEFNLLPLPYNNYSEQPIIPVSEISTNNMRHISTYDQNIISSTRKFEPKELDDITGSLRIFSNRSANNNLFSMINNKNNNKPISQRTNNNLNINSNNNSTNLKPYYGIGTKKQNIPETNLLNESYKDTNPNENIKDQKMKIDDLEQSKLLKESKNIRKNNKYNNITEDENKNIKLNNIIKLKNKEELNNILHELKQLAENKSENNNLNDSLYFLLENDMEESNCQSNNGKNSQIIKVKNNKITTFDSDSRIVDNSFKKELFFNYNNNNNFNNNIFKNNIFNNLNNLNNFNNMNNANNFNNIIINNDNNFNNINYINDPNNRLLSIKNNPHNNHTFKEIKNLNINKFLTENKCERHTYVGQNHLNVFNNNEFSTNPNDKSMNMIRGIQIKAIYNRNRSHGKDRKHKKKTGIIEQVKKEQNEKKNNIMHNTFNNRNKNILLGKNGTPYSNCKTQPYSKNSIAKIDYNNMYQLDPTINNINMNTNINIVSEQNDFIHHKKSKSVNINKCLSCSPKKKYEDFSKYNFSMGKQEKNNFFIYDNNNINNNNFIINKNSNYNDEEFKNFINMNNKKQEQENNSFILLRQKYLEFLIKTYGNNNNIPINKENEELDNIFLKGLVKNEVPIENINLNILKCSNDMKNFICQSLENFKLQQLKEKIANINNNNSNILNNNNEKNMNKSNNLNGLIQLDYEDENKDKSNILEPIELDKSNYNINFRKSFIESLSGIKNDNIFYNSENLIKKK